MTLPSAQHDRVARSAILWLLAMMVLVLVLIVLSLQQTRRDATQVAATSVRNLAQVLESRIAGDLDRVFGLLRVAAGWIDAPQLAGEQDFGKEALITAELAALRASFPEIEAISVFDAEGRMRFSSQPYPLLPSIIDTATFLQLRASPQQRMAFSDIVASPESGLPAISLAYALRDEQLRFIGVVQASLPIEALGDLLAGIDPGPGGLALLRRSDSSVLIAREPRLNEADFNQPLPAGNPIRRRIEAGEGEGSLSYLASTDQQRRIGHFKQMDHYPFYVQVAVAEADYLHAWRRQSWSYGVLALVMCAALLLALQRLRKGFAAEQAAYTHIEEQRQRLAAVIEGTDAGTWEWHLRGNRIECNARWAAICGTTPEALAPLDEARWFSLIHPEDREAVRAALAAHLDGSEARFDMEFRVHHPQTEWAWVHDLGRIVERDAYNHPTRLSGTRSDISERKRVERMKSEFISTVSHELRTPVTALSGALSMLRHVGADSLPEQAREMLGIAEKNSHRLGLLINDLLDMEKLAAGKLRLDLIAQPLRPVIEQAVRDNQTYADTFGVTLRLLPGADAHARIDADRLQQVLANLLSNAAKFSPRGGEVEVRLETRGERVRISVTDHGSGIPAAFRERIFQKFSQADASDTRQRGGTGLGLAISRELIERMGGTIGFDSVEGQGATFWFELPARRIEDH